MNLPWSDLKIAFDTSGWHGDLFDYLEQDKVKKKLPEGWVLDGCSGDGARSIVIFRVNGKIPTSEDGKIVSDILQSMQFQWLSISIPLKVCQ